MEDDEMVMYFYDFRNQEGFYFFKGEKRLFELELDYILTINNID